MKKLLSLVLVLIFCVISLSGCSPKGNKKYLSTVNNYSFWSNNSETSIAELNVYNIINDFMKDTQIIDGRAVDKVGKTRKVLFLGFDGMRADAVSNVLLDKNNFDTNGYNYNSVFSGIKYLSETGGVYLAYCGGEKGTDTQQQTSTSASWTSQFTGVWGNKHGIITNDDIKNMDYKTVMLQYAEKGLKASLAFDWDPYFDVNLKEEVEYLIKNPQIDLTYCDIDRKRATEVPKESKAENLELYNSVSYDEISDKAPYDIAMRDYITNRINSDDDMVFGIFHNIDSNGHTYEFSNNSYQYVNSVRNCDSYSYDLIKLAKEREGKYNEKWLVVMANDHGGIEQGHGGQTLEERTTWIATNLKLETKYFSRNYDGYNCN